MYRWPVQAENLSHPVAVLGGTLGVAMLLAAGRAAPLWGWPALQPELAFGGAWVFIPLHAVVVPVLLGLTWRLFPGGRTLAGALLRALVWWVVLSVALTAIVTIAFGFDPRLVALAVAGELLYALAWALVGWMPHGLSPIDALGWMWTSHGYGETP